MDYANFSFRSHFLQAYLISGPAGSGKLAAAKRLAAAMVCSGTGAKPCNHCRNCKKSSAGIHPDIILVTRPADKREITVDQIRTIRADASVLPNEAERKVYIICDAQSMNIQAQNALLKTLEEPPYYVTFLLLADNPSRLLETIRSRCAEIRMAPAGVSMSDQTDAKTFLSALLGNDRLQMAEVLFSLEKLDKFQLRELFCAIRTVAADQLRTSHTTYDRLVAILAAIDEGDQYLDANINVGSIAGLFLARLL
jgi:DNA polymerase-3 subunit delta'